MVPVVALIPLTVVHQCFRVNYRRETVLLNSAFKQRYFRMQKLRSSCLQGFVAVVLIFALAACTTTKSYTDSTLNKAIEALRPGDQIMVYTLDGRVYAMEVEAATFDSIRSSARSVDVQDIARIDLQQRSAAKTFAAVVGGTLVTVSVAIAALVLWDLSTPDD